MKNKMLSKFLKRQIFAICSCLVIAIFGTVLVSSALFTTSVSSTKTQAVKTGNFDVNFTNGSVISEDVFISSDSDGLASDGYTFTVKNTGSIESTYEILLTRNTRSSRSDSNLIDNQYIRYSLDGEAPKSLTSSEIKSGSGDEYTVYRIKTVNLSASSTKDHVLRVWIDQNVATSTAINKYVDLSIQVQAIATDVGSDLGYPFVFTGSEQTFTVPYTGTYTISASGAEGAIGNLYNKETTLKGGKGATISADFELNKGDVLHIIVGGKGSTTTGTSSNGAAGAGGGGSFVFKEISSISNSNYQFTKGSKRYDVLLVAAGGSGTGDIGYGYEYAGYDGNAEDFYSPSNFRTFSTTTASPTGSTSSSGVLGIRQYISYDLKGGRYSVNGSTCLGGYGGGNCNTSYRSYGGGWAGTSYVTYSWSQGDNTVGINGNNEGNGYVNIKLKS